MMYSNKLAVAVKANGKVLREFGDTVYVPFGTEYTILIKNLNSVRVQVSVHIDGTNTTEGNTLVIGPNEELELQRFIKNGNLKEGNRFKFIERTAKIEDGPRGAKIDDGLIRIEYQFEKLQPIISGWPTRSVYHFWQPAYPYDVLTNSGGVVHDVQLYGSTSVANSEPTLMNMACSTTSAQATSTLATPKSTAGSALRSRSRSLVPSSASAQAVAAPVENETGITVAGSKSDQEFRTVSAFFVESTTHSMVIHLLGETETGKAVVTPVTVKAKPKCVTCGRQNKATSKFCTDCGTSLEIV